MLRTRINMNGDAAGVLKDRLQAAHSKLSEAAALVSNLGLHGRNYQTSPTPRDDFMADYRDLMLHLSNMREAELWLTESWLAIDAQFPAVGD